MKYILLLFICTLSLHGMAQSDSLLAEEKRLGELFIYCHTRPKDQSSLEWQDIFHQRNEIFKQNLIAALRRPEAINYKFPYLKKVGITCTRSSDSIIQIFNWDMTEGTMGIWEEVVQFRGEDGNIHCAISDDRYLVDSVAHVNGGQYIIFQRFKASSILGGITIGNISLSNNKMSSKKPLFVIKQVLEKSIFLYTRDLSKSFDPHITYDTIKKRLCYSEGSKARICLHYDGSSFR